MGYSERQDCRYASLYSITQLIKQIKNSQLLSSLLWICQICKRKKEKKTAREGGQERERERSLPWGEGEKGDGKEKGRGPCSGMNTADRAVTVMRLGAPGQACPTQATALALSSYLGVQQEFPNS